MRTIVVRLPLVSRMDKVWGMGTGWASLGLRTKGLILPYRISVRLDPAGFPAIMFATQLDEESSLWRKSN